MRTVPFLYTRNIFKLKAAQMEPLPIWTFIIIVTMHHLTSQLFLAVAIIVVWITSIIDSGHYTTSCKPSAQQLWQDGDLVQISRFYCTTWQKITMNFNPLYEEHRCVIWKCTHNEVSKLHTTCQHLSLYLLVVLMGGDGRDPSFRNAANSGSESFVQYGHFISTTPSPQQAHCLKPSGVAAINGKSSLILKPLQKQSNWWHSCCWPNCTNM